MKCGELSVAFAKVKVLSINITVRSEVQLPNCPIYLIENSILPFDQSKDNTSGVQKTDKHKKLAETDQTESNFSVRFQFQCWIFSPKIDRVYICGGVKPGPMR